MSSLACQRSCGKIPIKCPFGSGPGCGDPRFQQFVTCNDQKHTLTIHTGCYRITNIDYMNQVIYLTDPSTSTRACTEPSTKALALTGTLPSVFMMIISSLFLTVQSVPHQSPNQTHTMVTTARQQSLYVTKKGQPFADICILVEQLVDSTSLSLYVVFMHRLISGHHLTWIYRSCNALRIPGSTASVGRNITRKIGSTE